MNDDPPPNAARMTPLPSPTTSVSIEATLEAARGRLHVRARIDNRAATAIFVLDEPWRISARHTVERDPERAYRYVVGDTLRILVGAPPLPKGRTVRMPMTPFATRVEPACALELDFALALPVREHGPFASARAGSADEEVTVHSIALYVQLVFDGPGVAAEPAAWPWATHLFTVPSASPIGGARPIDYVAASARMTLDALRYRGPFDRLTLPGGD